MLVKIHFLGGDARIGNGIHDRLAVRLPGGDCVRDSMDDSILRVDNGADRMMKGRVLKTGWDERHWVYRCSDGPHNSFWKTVVTSRQWEKWSTKARRHGFDVDECRECGYLSPKHFQAFLKFVRLLNGLK